MTEDVNVNPGLIIEHGWKFAVMFHGHRYRVTLFQDYWHKLTHGEISPMDLVRLGIELAIEQRMAGTLPVEFSLADLAARVNNFEKRLRAMSRAEATSNPR